MYACTLESSGTRAPWWKADLLLDWSRKKKSKCAAEDKHCSLSSVEVKETSAVFALWFEMVSVGNSPFSQIGLDVVSIYVFASCQDSLRKWKCSKMLVECVGTGACLSICIHVWEPVGVCMCKWVSWDQELFPPQNLRQTHKKVAGDVKSCKVQL